MLSGKQQHYKTQNLLQESLYEDIEDRRRMLGFPICCVESIQALCKP